MKKRRILILCFSAVLVFSCAAAAVVGCGRLSPPPGRSSLEETGTTGELPDSAELAEPKEIQFQQATAFDVDIPGDFELYTVASGNSLKAGEQVRVSGIWDPPVIGIWVRLVKDDGSRAITAPVTTTSPYTFTVPVSGIYDIQVAATRDIDGIMMAEWREMQRCL